MEDSLMLDANAVAGDLAEMFGFDVTASIHCCSHCGNRGAMATLLAYTHGPGVVCLVFIPKKLRPPPERC